MENLANELKQANLGRDVEVVCTIPNIAYPVLIFSEYMPLNDSPPVNFALSLENFPNKKELPRKYWCSIATVQPFADGTIPNFNQDYKFFTYKGYDYHPFSAALDDYSFTVLSVTECLSNLYGHVRFPTHE